MSERGHGNLTTEFTAWCGDPCSCWYQVCASGRRKAVRLLKGHGWRHTRRDGWRCPGCVKGIPLHGYDHKKMCRS